MSVQENLHKVLKQINDAEEKAGREKGSVKLLAVSKFHPQEAVLEAIKAGQLLFGENRVQEASQKFPDILEKNPDIQLQMIGQLQSNKVKQAVKIASCIQSVDRIELLEEIEKQCAKIDKKIEVLFEVHTGEESKSGFTSLEVLNQALENCNNNVYPHIIPSGFMTMAPFTDDKELIRKSFRTLRELKEQFQNKYPDMNLSELSMGMSGDFEIAIEEGSTMVRVGTAIFGERVY